MITFYVPKSVKFPNLNKHSYQSQYTPDYDNPITSHVRQDGDNKKEVLLYLSEVSTEGLKVHHVPDGKHLRYLKERHERPDIEVTYSSQKDMLLILDLDSI